MLIGLLMAMESTVVPIPSELIIPPAAMMVKAGRFSMMGITLAGGLGSWHLAIIFGLSLYGVGVFSASNPDPRASAFAMLGWGFQTLLLIVLGIYAFISMAIDRKRIESGKTVVDTTNDEIKL